MPARHPRAMPVDERAPGQGLPSLLAAPGLTARIVDVEQGAITVRRPRSNREAGMRQILVIGAVVLGAAFTIFFTGG